MAYDAQRKIFLPDFQADNRLPQWTPMGGEDDQGMGQDVGAIGNAFKQRLMSGANTKGALPVAGAEGKAGGAAGGGGGAMKSLG